MGAHEAFLASGNRATRWSTLGKVRARRRRNQRVVSTLTARQPKSWHFYGLRIGGPDTRHGRSARPSLPNLAGRASNRKFLLRSVARCLLLAITAAVGRTFLLWPQGQMRLL